MISSKVGQLPLICSNQKGTSDMPAAQERTFTVEAIDGTKVQVHRSPERLFLDGLPTAFITPDVSGTVHIFTGRPHWTIRQLNRYIFSGSTFWDILYDVEPTKEFAGQLQALMMQFQHLAQQFVTQLPDL
jgi:hypothetical protein